MKSRLLNFCKITWLFTKYQIMTKSILLLVVFPIYNTVVRYLIGLSGRAVISSGDYLSFILSLEGCSLFLITLLLLVLLLGIDINSFIIMSALIKEGKIDLKARHLIVVAIKSLRSFFSISGVFLIAYMAIIVPLVGVGFTFSVTEKLRIPNFVTDVIYKNPLYSFLYLIVLIILTVVTIRYIFTLHYVLLLKENIKTGLRKSALLVRNHWKNLIKELLKYVFILLFISLIALVIIIILLETTEGSKNVEKMRLYSIFILLTVSELAYYITLMIVPIFCNKITNLFYKYNEEDGQSIKINAEYILKDLDKCTIRKTGLGTKLGIVIFLGIILALNLLVAEIISYYFDDFFRNHRKIDIVAHRAGGDLAAENSILGLDRAAEKGASYGEIDVQRTLDGHYIINHDKTFMRVAGVNKSSKEMTLAEIKKLRIKDLFDINRPSEPVATIEEFLDAAKGRIGLFIELKGETADEKMADDVISMVKERGMTDEIAILSLDYKLIGYVESKYPEINTGYLYFFSIGEQDEIISDFLIMEENEATPEKVERIHEAGKRAIVWTVNTEESVRKFVNSEVDGIITDYVLLVEDGIKERDGRSDIEVIIDTLLTE